MQRDLRICLYIILCVCCAGGVQAGGRGERTTVGGDIVGPEGLRSLGTLLGRAGGAETGPASTILPAPVSSGFSTRTCTPSSGTPL